MNTQQTPESTLEEFFRFHYGKAVDFTLRVEYQDLKPRFYIHPQGVDGLTWDFEVQGNTLTTISSSLS